MTVRNKPGLFLLQTKLNRPGVTRDLVIRPRLLELLDKGLEGPLTLVVAPAGFGKTTLVSSWLQSTDGESGITLPATWLSLDEGDSDRDLFLRYFVAAVQKIFPDTCADTLKLLNARQPVPTKILLGALSNEIEQLPSRFVLVIDDLHAPQDRAICEILNEWLQHWPRKMHLVLLSRSNPALSLSSLRAKGLLTEIRSRELRFTLQEATAYFERTLNRSPDESTISLLYQQLEGWIAGLKMASLAQGDSKSMKDIALALLDSDVYIADYLIEEVIANQPPSIQRFLLKTSILNQFSVSLAETLMDAHDAECDVRECVGYLEAADLFLIPLERQHEWYRYHRLFRDVLRQRLSSIMSAVEIEAMHVRAAGWYFDNDQLDQAIRHALDANNLPLAASYIEQGLCDALNREDRATLERWLRMLPESFIIHNPGLLIMRAYAHGLRWELSLVSQSAKAAEALIDKNDPSERTRILLGLINVQQGQAHYLLNQYEKAMINCQEALARLPVEWHYARGIACLYLGLSLYASGQPEAAQQFLSKQYETYGLRGDSYALRLLMAMAINQIQAGNYENAERIAQTILLQAEQNGLPVMKGWAHYLLGFLNYEWNALGKAAEHFEDVVELHYITQFAVVRNAMIGLAYATQAQGRVPVAQQTIDRLSSIDLETRGQEGVDTLSARARLLFMSGNTEAAERWIPLDTSQLLDQSLLMWMEQPSLMEARILLARNRGPDIQKAIHLLDTILELAERTYNVRITIEVLALRSLALLCLGDSAGAQDTLIRSVELARRGLFTRTFVDQSPQMRTLLSQISGHVTVSRSVKRILAAFPNPDDTGPASQPAELLPATEVGGLDDADPHEQLTQRELETLLLMAEPISFREVASRMNISYATARRYTINVYSKFGVHSRWEAVDIAIRKGILPPR